MTIQPVVPSWRLTRTLALSGGLLAAAAVWFTIGLFVHTPPQVGWLPLLVAAPTAAIASWRAAAHGRTMWRYASARDNADRAGL